MHYELCIEKALTLQFPLQHDHLTFEILVGRELLFNGRHSVQNRRMRPIKFIGDVREGQIRQTTRKIHGDLPRPGDASRTALALHIRVMDVIVFSNKMLDMLNRHLRVAFLHENVA